jgi:hypothetical protein
VGRLGRPGPQPQADLPNAGGTASRMRSKRLKQVGAKDPTGAFLRLQTFRTTNYLDERRSVTDRTDARTHLKATAQEAKVTLDSGVAVYEVHLLALAEEAGTVVVTVDDKLLGSSHGHALRPPRSSPDRRQKPLIPSTNCRPRMYCNRADTHYWYTMDKATPPDHRKPPK